MLRFTGDGTTILLRYYASIYYDDIDAVGM